jgi:hypothetical protein
VLGMFWMWKDYFSDLQILPGVSTTVAVKSSYGNGIMGIGPQPRSHDEQSEFES